MSISFQPNFIRRDSAVPMRLVVGGWFLGVLVALVDAPLGNRLITLMGLTLLAGGLLAAMLTADRTVRMLVGALAGSIAAWLGYRFAVTDRLMPIVDTGVAELANRERFGAILAGASVLAIGLGGMLEALRSQSEPGQSNIIVRIVLLVVGMFLAAMVCTSAGVSGGITVLVTLAAGLLLAALAWLRAERPPEEFQPAP